MSRYTVYNDETVSAICTQLAEGKTLREICKQDGMPVRSTIHLWVIEKPEFAEKYKAARMLQAELLFEETLEIADNGTNDWMERNGEENPGYSVNGEHINRSRLRVDTRKWFIGKVAPKIYGDKTTHEHTGPDGGPVTVIERVITDPTNTDG